MSWLFKSLQFNEQQEEEQQNDSLGSENDGGLHGGGGVGVKQDLTAIGESISRQFRGVATFLAPPPEEESSSADALAGIRSDLAEIGGTFKNSLSLFSTQNAVSEISKLASNFLQFSDEGDNNSKDSSSNVNDNDDDYDDDEEEEEYGVGINDGVIEFARQISNRPELWIDFPLSFHQEFHMSDVQSEHASIIEQLVPSLSDLKSRMSSDTSDNQFWMIYFILLLPRLSEDDLEILSTPEIVEARETLLLMLQSKKDEEINTENPQSDSSSELENKVHDAEHERSQSVGRVVTPENLNVLRSAESNDSDNTKKSLEMEDSKTAVSSSDHNQSDVKADDSQIRTLSNKETVVAEDSRVGLATKEQENVDHWKEEEEPLTTATSAAAPKRIQSEDDVSFSDFEDDDNHLSGRPSGSGQSYPTRTSSPEGSSDWVRLNRNVESAENMARGQSSLRGRDSEGEESTDWLTVDDFDS